MQFKVDNLTKQFSNLNKQITLNFELKTGEVLAVLGENSAGKSTCLKLLAGFLQADSGNIFLNGKLVNLDLATFQQKIGYLPEDIGFNKNLTLKYYLKFFAKCKIDKNSKSEWRLEKIIREFGLNSKLQNKISTLSKGYKQRLALAATLINNPKILILDEATQGLDFNQKQEFYKILQQRQAQTITIISTHYLQEALQLATKVLILKDFEPVFFGTKAKLLELAKKFADKTFSIDSKLLKSQEDLQTQAYLIENFLNFGDLQNANKAN